jgi:hypothetical protein
MNPGTRSSLSHRMLWMRGAHLFASLLMSLAMCAAWLPTASADPLPPPPYSIVIDRLTAPIDSGSGVEFHAGQRVEYRVRAYDNTGKLTSCNPEGNNQPQVLSHNPATGTVVQQAWGATAADGSSVVDAIMGNTAGAAFLEVACGSAVKKVLLSNDGEPVPPSQQNQPNPPNNQSFNTPPPAAAQGGSNLAGQSGAGQPQTPPPDDASASSSDALLIAGLVAVAVVGVVAIAAAAGGGGSSSGGGCSSSSHQCSPPNATVCCPNGTTIYCTNTNTCTNLTSANFGDVCGNQADADGC